MDNNDNINTIDDENIENEELIEDIDYGGEFHEKDKHIENNIVSEVKTSFLDYSMSVITSRALPDLRDGLKPVHRRILWSMYEEGNTPDKPHKKSATTVGYVMGHYHHTETHQFMMQWLDLLKTLISVICLLMVMETSVQSKVTHQLLTVIQRQDLPRFLWNF